MSSLWTEHRNPEGRTYWYNNETKQSVWEKPDALKTPFERALGKTPWKEYVANGRKYWYHTETKQSKWDMPEDLTELLTQVEKEFPGQAHVAPKPIISTSGALGTPSGSQSIVATAGTMSTTFTPAQVPLSNGALISFGTTPAFTPTARPSISLPISTTISLPSRPNLPPDPVIPQGGFATPEEAEKAFMHLLRKAGVDANWTWDQTMRAAITDPLYKALKSLAEKKAAWQKYVEDLKAKEAEEKESRLQRLRPAFKNLFSSNNNIHYYTTFRTAEKIFAGNPTWLQVKLESERRLLFDEHLSSLMEKQTAATREMRTRNISKVVVLLKELDVNVTTRWRSAQAQVIHSEQWANDAELRQLAPLDMLLAYEDYSRVLERDYEEVHRKTQIHRTRQERKAREGFKELLDELRREGHIKAKTKWKTIYPLLAEDPRYLTLLGNPGSTPLELFWDIVDDLCVQLEAMIAPVEQVLAERNFVFGHDVAPEDFHRAIEGAPSLSGLAEAEEHDVYEHLHERAVRRYADEKRRAERRSRHMQDDLRYAMKKLEPPVELDLSYEDAVHRIQDLEEFKVLDDEDARRAAFAKFIKRQKEKLREASEDGGSATSRKRKDGHNNGRSRRDYEPEHDRDRDRQARSSFVQEERHGSRRDVREEDKDKRHEKTQERDRDRDRPRERERGHADYDKSHRASRHREERRSSKRSGRDEETGRERDNREWDETHRGDYDPKRDRDSYGAKEGRDRRDWSQEKDDRELSEERAHKRPRVQEPSPPAQAAVRADTPEEGEI